MAIEPSDQETFTIGEAARRLKVSTATLRTWEELGRLVPEGRTRGNRRYYTTKQIEQFKAENRTYKYVRTKGRKTTGG